MTIGSIVAIYFLFFAASAFVLLPFGVRTDEEAGLLYRWNTGATQKEWHRAPIKRFRLEHLPDVSNFPVVSDD